MASASTESEYELWGWEVFFEQLAVFFHESGKQFGKCSENYMHHALKRLEVCIMNVVCLQNHLEDNIEQVQQDDLVVDV